MRKFRFFVKVAWVQEVLYTSCVLSRSGSSSVCRETKIIAREVLPQEKVWADPCRQNNSTLPCLFFNFIDIKIYYHMMDRKCENQTVAS